MLDARFRVRVNIRHYKMLDTERQTQNFRVRHRTIDNELEALRNVRR